MRKIFTLLCLPALAIIQPWRASAQCTVNAVSTSTDYCVGATVNITASVQVSGAYSFDFNNSTLPPGWSAAGGFSFVTPCAAPSLDNSPFYWSSTSATLPSIETADLNVSSGGNLIFDFRFYPNSGTSPCETADQPNEGVAIEYSTDAGATWNLVNYFCSVPAFDPAQILNYIPTVGTPGNGNGSCGIFNNWATYSLPIPPAAQTTSTRFRWIQPNSSGSCCDNWGLDNINVNASPNVYYDWGGGTAGYGLSNVTFTATQDTCIYLEVTDTMNNSICYDTICIDVFDLPVAVLQYDNPICAGEEITFDGSGTTPIGGISNYEFDLNNDGTYEYNFTNPIHNFTYFVIAGNYTVGYRVTTPGGCSAEQDFPVQVYNNPTVTVAANPLEICKGVPINLLGQGSIINPPSLPSTLGDFLWDFNNDGTTDVTDAGTGTGTSKQSAQSYTFPLPGTFWAKVEVVTSGGCSRMDSVQIMVHDNPIAQFVSDTACLGDQTTLVDASSIIPPDVIDTYAWTVTDGGSFTFNSSANGSVDVPLPGTGVYIATLIVESQAGCRDTFQNTLQVFPQPTANFSYIVGCFNQNTFIDQSFGGTEPYGLAWDLNNDGISDTTNISNFVYLFPDSSSQQLVHLSLVDSNGCASDTTMLVDIKGGVSKPNMPNVMALSSTVGNDKMDFQLFAPGFNDCVDYTLYIYNRWGTLVYEAKNDMDNPDINCSNCFTGKTKTGSTIEPGTYYYVLKGSGNNGQFSVEDKGMFQVFQ